MKTWICTFLFLTSLIAESALSATLIVTHPEKMFDSYNATGARTREYLQDPRFDKKIVLTTNHEFTFSAKGLTFKKIYSAIGDFKWDGSEADVYLAGGFFHACQLNSLTSIISGSKTKGPLTIHILKDASYSQSVKDDEDGTVISVSLNDLKSAPQQIRDQINTEFLEGLTSPRNWLAFNPEGRAIEDLGQITKRYTITIISSDGAVVFTHGHGPKEVTIIMQTALK